MKRTLSPARTILGIVLSAYLASAACTMKNQEAPPLAGPSEYGTAITITVSPDQLTQDGASQSLVTITARDQFGNPLPNLSLRAEIFVDGSRVDFGSLSARNLVTDARGEARLVFTAPASPSGPSVETFTTVQIVVTPVGTDFGNGSSRLATIRLVPPGVVVPPDGLQPNFTPADGASFVDHETVLFDGSLSTAPPNNPIVSYTWNFGDGQTGSGIRTTHSYPNTGTFFVTLTIADQFGRAAQATHTVTITESARPTAAFTVSPGDPVPGQNVFFNASGSRAAPGHRIVSYTWDFGDGSPIITTSSPNTNKQPTGFYPLPGSYRVTLVVTDETGKTDDVDNQVAVAFPSALTGKGPVKK